MTEFVVDGPAAILQSLKRIARPVWRTMRRAEHGLRDLPALRRANRDAKAAARRLQELKLAHPDRPLHGILLVEHIGDIIACEPVIEFLRQQSPDALIIWLVRDRYAELLSSHPGLDHVITVESLASVGQIVRARVFDAVFDLHVNGKPIGIGARKYDKHWGNPEVSATTYFEYGSLLRAFSQAAGLPALDMAPKLYIPPQVGSVVDRLDLPTPRIVVHAKSNDRLRDWSDEGWNALARHILDDCRLPVVEVGMSQTIRVEHPDYHALCGKLSLMETAEVIRRSGYFVGVDSGPAHMANAWRRPALLLFGRFAGRDTWCPYDGYYREHAGQVFLRHFGPLSELSASAAISRLSSDRAWQALQPHKPPTPTDGDG